MEKRNQTIQFTWVHNAHEVKQLMITKAAREFKISCIYKYLRGLSTLIITKATREFKILCIYKYLKGLSAVRKNAAESMAKPESSHLFCRTKKCHG